MRCRTPLLCAGSQAQTFTNTAFGTLIPTPPDIASYLNNHTGNQFSYLINQLLGSGGEQCGLQLTSAQALIVPRVCWKHGLVTDTERRWILIHLSQTSQALHALQCHGYVSA